jgi:hypothetical protein
MLLGSERRKKIRNCYLVELLPKKLESTMVIKKYDSGKHFMF